MLYLANILLSIAAVYLEVVATEETLSTDCPTYVLVGTDLSCQCQSSVDSSGASFSWVGVSSSATLSVASVTPAQNGTVYVCQRVDSGQTTTINYTMKVAYGPTTAVIPNPTPFVTDGTKTLIVTCRAEGVNPSATYTWYPPNPDRRCHPDTPVDQCVMTPRPGDEGVFTCRASNAFQGARNIHAEAQYTLTLQYEARVKSFTVNQAAALEVDQGVQSDVTFSCQAAGLLTVSAWLVGPSGRELNRTGPGSGSGEGVVEHTLTDPRCNDTGIYTCFADNGAGSQNSTTVNLTVSCGPGGPSLDDSSSPHVLTNKGLTFELVAVPVPDISIDYVGSSGSGDADSKTTSHTGADAQFQIRTSCRPLEGGRAECAVRPVSVPQHRLGVYNVTVSNRLGQWSTTVVVNTVIAPPRENDSSNTGAIVGGVIGALVVVAIIVAGVWLWSGGLKRKAKHYLCQILKRQVEDGSCHDIIGAPTIRFGCQDIRD